MSEHVEIEFKNGLTEAEFTRLLAHFAVQEQHFIHQANHYFDTVDFQLKEAESALRIREKNGTFELTLKQPHRDGLLETNQPISPLAATALQMNNILPDGPVADKLRFVTKPLVCFGSLTTERFEIEYGGGLLVLDKSTYLNVTDYELEFEASEREAGERAFATLLAQFSLPVTPIANKIVRFKRRLTELEG